MNVYARNDAQQDLLPDEKRKVVSINETYVTQCILYESITGILPSCQLCCQSIKQASLTPDSLS